MLQRGVRKQMSKESDEYGTPAWIIETCSNALGGRGFDLDAFSSQWHHERLLPALGANCEYYSKDESALDNAWGRPDAPINVWANPPYSAGLLGRCVDRWIEAVEGGETLHAFLLVPASPATKWAQRVMQWPTCMLARRIKHYHPLHSQTQPLSGTRHDSMLIYAGSRPPWFRAAFGEHGVIR